MTNSQSSNKLSLSTALLMSMSLFGNAYAAPVANNVRIERSHVKCPPFYRPGGQQQCVPYKFARVWHVAPTTRAPTVVALPNQSAEVFCYGAILATGANFQQFTWVRQTQACTYTAGAAVSLGGSAAQPTSFNLIATDLAGGCATNSFSNSGTPGIPCQDVQIVGTGGGISIGLVNGRGAPYTVEQALSMATKV